MLPESELYQIQLQEQPTDTYYIQAAKERILGHTKGLEAMKQAIYKILNTQRYQELIYSHNYGVELYDLFGKPYDYVCSELPRRITEALTQDDRIQEIKDFSFSRRKSAVAVTFMVITTEGKIESELEVAI